MRCQELSSENQRYTVSLCTGQRAFSTMVTLPIQSCSTYGVTAAASLEIQSSHRE